MKIQDFELFKFGENFYYPFGNNGKNWLINKSPYLDIVLTDHCNSDCQFCIADLVHDKLNADFDTFKKKIDFAVGEMGVREVLLLGGEPTVSKLLVPMIKWLKEHEQIEKIIMTTNGLRLAHDSDLRQEIFQAGLTHINISYMNTDIEKQKAITGWRKGPVLSKWDISAICHDAYHYGVKSRVNNNICKGNNDTIEELSSFYDNIKGYCDSVKFSPLFSVDKFSVIDIKTEWVQEHMLADNFIDTFFRGVENYYKHKHGVSVIDNDLQFGFVKNSMIPLSTPIILNWNFGRYTGMMKKVVDERKINNLKLLPNGELSLSWNRELSEYFIKVD